MQSNFWLRLRWFERFPSVFASSGVFSLDERERSVAVRWWQCCLMRSCWLQWLPRNLTDPVLKASRFLLFSGQLLYSHLTGHLYHQRWWEKDPVISCYGLVVLWKITWSGISKLSFEAGYLCRHGFVSHHTAKRGLHFPDCKWASFSPFFFCRNSILLLSVSSGEGAMSSGVFHKEFCCDVDIKMYIQMYVFLFSYIYLFISWHRTYSGPVMCC